MSDGNERQVRLAERAGEDTDIERAMRQVGAQLQQRGVTVHDGDDAEGQARMLEAVEAFEGAVRRCGGDSFTNTRESSRPDRPDFVLPARGDDERADTYARRVQAAAAALATAAPDDAAL